jgi:hypothetical protein
VNVVNDRVEVIITDWEYGKEYEIAITDSVRFGGNTIDARNTLIGRGTVTLVGQQTLNWYSNFNFQQKTTIEALRQIKDSFPALPTINIKSWFKNHAVFPITDTLGRDIQGTDTDALINAYYEIKYQIPPTGYQAMRVYRRVINKNNLLKTTSNNNQTAFYQVGPWEMVRITSFGSVDSDNFYTANLRPPIDWRYFNTYYGVPAQPSRFQLVDVFNRVGQSSSGTIYYPIAPTFTSSGGSTNAFETQYLFVLEKTSGGAGVANVNTTTDIEPKAKFLTGFYSSQQFTNGFNSGVIEREVDVSEFIGVFDAEYQRNLEQAITGINTNRLRTATGASFPSKFTSTRWPQNLFTGTITRAVAAPSGITLL